MISRNKQACYQMALIAAIAFLWSVPGYSAPDAQKLYNGYCIACHGSKMDAGIGGSLVDAEWKYVKNDKEMVELIKKGIPEKGMMPFEKILKDPQIDALVKLIRSKAQPAQE